MILQNYFKLMRLDKPIGIFLLLWPTLIALMLSTHGKPQFKLILIFVLGVIVMRSAGCIVNDIADRNFDKHVERTKNRPLVNKSVSVKEALYLVSCLFILAFALVLQLNLFTVALSFFALLLTLLYPFMKRFISMPQAILGLAFGIGIPMAFCANNSVMFPTAYILYFATFCWVIAYDTQYAMADKIDDLKIGVKSTAIYFGRYDKIIIFFLQLIFVAAFCYIGYQCQLNWPYYLGLVFALGFLFYQYYLIKNREAEKCFKAFLNNHYVGLSIFLGLCFSYW